MDKLLKKINMLNANKIMHLKLCYIMVLVIIVLSNMFLSVYSFIFLKEKPLNLSEFEHVGMEFVDEKTGITATEDSQIIYSAEEPILNLYFKPDTLFDVGEWVLFYQDDVDKDFSANKMLHAKLDGEYYCFSLPINTYKIRFDLGVTTSNTIHFEELILNKVSFGNINAFDVADVFNLLVLPIILYIVIIFALDVYLKLFSRVNNKK